MPPRALAAWCSVCPPSPSHTSQGAALGVYADKCREASQQMLMFSDSVWAVPPRHPLPFQGHVLHEHSPQTPGPLSRILHRTPLPLLIHCLEQSSLEVGLQRPR